MIRNREFVLTNAEGPLAACPHIVQFGTLRHRHYQPERLHMHTNPGIEICYSWGGTFKWDVEGQMHRLRPGAVSVTCPWQRHGGAGGALDIGVLTWIIIAPAVFGPRKELHLGDWSTLLPADERAVGSALKGASVPVTGELPAAGRLLQELYDELHVPGTGSASRVNWLVCDLLVQAVRALGARGSGATPDAGVERVIDAVEADVAHPWSLHELSSVAGCGVTSLTGRFRHVTGLTPQQYVISRRMEAARERLVHEDTNITDIALELGFSSSQHFANTFRKHTGMTPKSFRSALISTTS